MEWIAFLITLFVGFLGCLLEAYGGIPGAASVLSVSVMGVFIIRSMKKKDQ